MANASACTSRRCAAVAATVAIQMTKTGTSTIATGRKSAVKPSSTPLAAVARASSRSDAITAASSVAISMTVALASG